jgi:hypothetical protein
LRSCRASPKIRDLMSGPHTAKDIVEQGREAASRGDWREAYQLLVAVAPEALSPEDLELIGEAASWSGPTERCIEAHERAHAALPGP